jgi:class 3 adenylate cyclase/tetratricopeptide (TPR) repeat protein
MKCAACSHDNPAGSRFCLDCGRALALACPACGVALPAGARFCNACGAPVAAAASGAPAGSPSPGLASPQAYTPRHLAERILTSRAALQGERKAVTVLFCDVVGSTALAERLGADAMHDLLNRFFEVALAEVHRYEGTVNQFLGDGFMALFGAPLAHEDHARRAALAALGVARAVGAPLPLASGEPVTLTVRMGLHTGLVVVGAIGDNLRMDYTAVGDTTHLAARLQQAAPPGAVLASETTARLAGDDVTLERVGQLELRGLTGPVTAFRLVAPAPRSARERAGRRSRSRFVGRGRELATLQELFAEVERGHGRVAGVVAEAGLGKSRLLAELRQAIGSAATCLEGRCLSYGSAIPYLPILDLVRGLCGIADTDTPERTAETVRATLDDLGLDELRAAHLLHLLGVKTDERLHADGADVLASRMLDTLRQVWLRSSRRRPVILLVEDLHWIDRASEACLGGLAETLGGAAILLIATYRPGYRPPWIERSYATQISLAPLRRDDSLHVVRSLLPQLAADDPRARVILDKGEGNPFFLEELAHVVADGEAGPLPVPDSVQGVLAARIDRLPPPAKETLQTASVLGREFPERLLRAVANAPGRLDDDLRELTRQEFLYERTDADEPAYAFKHALTQEVARATLITARRQALHRAAAAGLARLYPDRVAELAPVLAFHYLEAEAWAEAVEPARVAAGAARRAWANSEALMRYDHALRAAERAGLPAAERRALLEARGDVHALLGHFEPARADLEAALTLAEAAGDAVAQARILTALGALWGGHKDYARGIELTRRAVAVIEPTGDRRVLAEARAQVGVMLLNRVRMTESRDELRAAMALFEQLGDSLGAARTREVLAMNLQLSGHADAAIVQLEQALALLRAAGDRRTEIPALVSLGAAYAWTRGPREGLPCLHRGLEIAQSLEIRSDEAFMRAAVADFGIMFGEYARGYREATAALAIAQELGHREWTAYALSGLGRVHAECGMVDEARRLHEEQLRITRELGASIWIADAQGNLGQDLLLAGDLAAATAQLEEAVQTAGECAKAMFPLLNLGELALRRRDPAAALAALARFRTVAADFRVLLQAARRLEAEAWFALGRHAEAEAALRDVVGAADVVGLRPTVWRAGLALAEVLAARGRPGEAHAAAAAVVARLEDFARELPEPLAPAFVESPLVRRARVLARR